VKLILGALPMVVLLAAGLTNAQTTPQPAPDTQPSPTHKMSRAEKNHIKGKVLDLNTASKEELAGLPDVGPDYAQKIVDGRPYSNKHELLKKKILPEETYQKVQDHITASRDTATAKPKDAPDNQKQ
jgi:competence protein ComEA